MPMSGRYFGGFLLLPWLWFVNYLYFKDVVKAPHASQQLKTSKQVVCQDGLNAFSRIERRTACCSAAAPDYCVDFSDRSQDEPSCVLQSCDTR